MEIFWWTWTCTVVALLLLFPFYSRKKRNLPPGPFSWPMFGSLFLLLGRSRHQSLARLSKKYGPVMYIELGCRPHVVISSSKMAREVLKEHDIEFASRPQYHTFFKAISHGFNDLAFAPLGDHWKFLRRISGIELFTNGRVASFARIRRRELEAFGSTVRESSSKGLEIDMSVVLHELFTNLMTGVLLGRTLYGSEIPLTPEAEAYKTVSAELVRESGKVYIGDFVPALKWIDRLRGTEKILKNNIQVVENFLNANIEEHKKDFNAEHPRDFVDVMLSLKGENKLDNRSIVALLQNLLIAGTNTSKGTVEWGLSELIRNPRVQQRAQEEMDQVIGRDRVLEEADLKNLPYMQAVVKEVLRLHPVAPTGLPHCNPEPARLAGYNIPANTTLFINLWAIQRDPDSWKEPESFCPERFLQSDHNVLGQHFDLIPFSSGRRRCVGLPLAMPHVTLTLAYLVQQFEWRTPVGKELDMSETRGIAVIPEQHRVVCASRRV